MENKNCLSLHTTCIFFFFSESGSHGVHVLMLVQGYVNFGRFDFLNYFVAGSGQVDFVQVS